MKILILANNDVGLYKFRKELMSELLCPGSVIPNRIGTSNEIFVSCPIGNMAPLTEELGCRWIDTPVDRRGINPITDLKLILHYYKLVRRIRPGYVITYTIKPNVYGGLVCRFGKIKYAANITGLGSAFEHENLIKKIVTNLYKIALKHAYVAFFENEDNAKAFVDSNILSKQRICQLSGAGVNLNDYSFADYPAESDPIRFLFIGRVMKEKGVEELFSAAIKIKEKYFNIEIDVVGPYEDDYRRVINNLQGKLINYYGFQADVRPFIRNCHCFVLPSYHEGMANTLLESAAIGRPLIASDIPGCREAITPGVNGYLCKSHDPEDLYCAMTRFLETSYAEKVRMGRESRKLVESKFDKKEVIAKTIMHLF